MKRLMAVVLLGMLPWVSAAKEKAPAPPVAEKLAEDFEKTKQELEKQELKQRQILSALYSLNRKIKAIVSEKSSTQQKYQFLQMNIKKLEEQIADLNKRTSAQKTLLGKRLKAIYKLGGASFVRFILSSENMASLQRNLRIMGIVAERDIQLISQYQMDVKALALRQKQLSDRLQHLTEISTKISTQEQALKKEQKLKNKLLAGIRKNQLFAKNKIAELRTRSLALGSEDLGLLDVVFQPSFADQKGELPKPVQGTVKMPFGIQKSSQHSYSIPHKGIFLGSKFQEPVKAVFEGTVSYAGELPGFGRTVVVDHGDHYYTVYAHAEELKVKTGESVSQNQIVATAGKSRLHADSGVYFEIRHFSEPYDPQQWMKGL